MPVATPRHHPTASLMSVNGCRDRSTLAEGRAPNFSDLTS